MCCAVQSIGFERFLSEEGFPQITRNKKSIKSIKPRARETTTPAITKTDQPDKHDTAGGPPTGSTMETAIKTPPPGDKSGKEDEKDKGKKKKKWKVLPLTDTGFVITLFPRPTQEERLDPDEEERILQEIERENDKYDTLVEKYPKFDLYSECFDGKVRGEDHYVRSDRDRKIRKAARQVKDKYCRSVKNNAGRKKLYIHHRLSKIIQLEVNRQCYLPSPFSKRTFDGAANKSQDSNRSRLKPIIPRPAAKSAPPQSLAHALHNSNAPTDIDASIVSVLIGLQHRELSPEDYDLLLRLDESVAPKTLAKSTIESFRTDVVDETSMGDMCAVCMEPYQMGQQRKFLPCNHVFHSTCINMWLENSSLNCPIDGLPVEA